MQKVSFFVYVIVSDLSKTLFQNHAQNTLKYLNTHYLFPVNPKNCLKNAIYDLQSIYLPTIYFYNMTEYLRS